MDLVSISSLIMGLFGGFLSRYLCQASFSSLNFMSSILMVNVGGSILIMSLALFLSWYLSLWSLKACLYLSRRPMSPLPSSSLLLLLWWRIPSAALGFSSYWVLLNMFVSGRGIILLVSFPQAPLPSPHPACHQVHPCSSHPVHIFTCGFCSVCLWTFFLLQMSASSATAFSYDAVILCIIISAMFSRAASSWSCFCFAMKVLSWSAEAFSLGCSGCSFPLSAFLL